jgi:Ca2+-binding RTX toxin-like protein
VKSSGVVDFRDVDLLYIRAIYLSSAGNTLEMGPGGFFVFGGSGNDVIVGSAYGADVSGGDGDDIIIGKADYDILDGQAGNDRIEGNGAGDSLRGGTGADHLMGGDGNDELIGGAGNDLLVGGAGSDDFRFKALSDGRDTISDFNSAQGDVLVFANLLHGTFSYRGTAAFTASGNSEARFEGGTVLCDIDGNGIANITIVLTGITAATQLTAADFAIW